MKKYSRQKEVITSILMNTTSHPTAEAVFMKAKEQLPDISLATVYRNLREMKRLGNINTVICGDDKEHFDGDTSPHAHLFCKHCAAVEDVFLTEEQLDSLACIKNQDFSLVFFGTCSNCKNGLL